MKVVKSTSICLQSGMLLSKEILEQMNAQSRLFQLQYTDYPDGILYGLEPFEKNGILYLSIGMLKYQGKYFFLESPMNLFDILDEFDEKKWALQSIGDLLLCLLNKKTSTREYHRIVFN